MGFKINKSKSWKKLGKEKYWKKTGESAGEDQDNFWRDTDGSKEDWFKDKDGSKIAFFEDSDGSKKKFFEGFGKEENWAKTEDIIVGGANGTKKTWNAASAGLGRAMGGMSDMMSNIMLAGIIIVGVSVVVPVIFPDKKGESND